MSPKTREIIERAALENDVSVPTMLSGCLWPEAVAARWQAAKELHALGKKKSQIARLLSSGKPMHYTSITYMLDNPSRK